MRAASPKPTVLMQKMTSVRFIEEYWDENDFEKFLVVIISFSLLCFAAWRIDLVRSRRAEGG